MSDICRYFIFSGPDLAAGTVLRISGTKISFVIEALLSNPLVT